MVDRRRFVAGMAALALIAAACTSGASPSPSAAGSEPAPAASADRSAAPADPLAELEATTTQEGALSSYGMPPDWTNFGIVWDVFLSQHGLSHTDTDMDSAVEIQKFDAEKNNPVADIGDIGIQFGPIAVQQGVVQPYKTTNWDKVPDWAKDPDGNWVCWYTGTVAFAVNKGLVTNVPTSWADLLKPEYKGLVGIDDPRTSGQGAMSFLAANFAYGGDENNLQPGFDYFKKLSDAGNLIALGPGNANIEKGEVAVGIKWDFKALPLRDSLKGKVDLDVVIPSDGTTVGPYCNIINKYAKHPAAAKLFREYILSPEVQLIQARAYARPIRSDVALPPDVAAKFPPAESYASVKPITDWAAATKSIEQLATEWTFTVGQ